MLRIQAICTSTRFDVTQVPEFYGVFPWENVFGQSQKKSRRKKKQKHRSVLSGATCCELKLCADRVRSRTQERESPERQISVRNLIFRLPLAF